MEQGLFTAAEWEDFLKGMIQPIAALAIVVVAVIMSFVQKLDLEKDMLYSIARAFIQLTIIGFVLEFIFKQKNVTWIFADYIFMVLVAGYTAGQRAKGMPKGAYIAGISIFCGTSITLFLLLIMKVFPLTPRYVIPITGMMVGSTMNVTGVTLKRLREDIKAQQHLIEAALALGATPRQASKNQVKRALVIALAPTLDSTKTVGLIALPGAMTGLIMAGASPLEAIRLQIVVMNMLLGACTFSSMQPRLDLRKTVSRTRLSSHHLAIETGRWQGLAREDRLCPCCLTEPQVEDEAHALLFCPSYEHIRQAFNVDVDKLQDLFNMQPTRLGAYLKSSFKERLDVLHLYEHMSFLESSGMFTF